MDDEFLLVGDRIPLHEARFYFHQVTQQMISSPGFSQSMEIDLDRLHKYRLEPA